MDRLMKPAEVAEALGYRDMNRVREIMREMIHMESPLRVSEKALEKWINQRMYEGIRCGGGDPSTSLRMTKEGRIPRRKGGKGA